MSKEIIIICVEIKGESYYQIGRQIFNSKEELLKYVEKQINENDERNTKTT